MNKRLILIFVFTVTAGSAKAASFKCPKTYKAFKDEILKLEKKADQEADKADSARLAFETGERGELMTLITPDRIPAGMPMRGFAVECWAKYYEFSESLNDLSSEANKKRSTILQKWKTCFQRYYPNKSLGSEIIDCHKSLAK